MAVVVAVQKHGNDYVRAAKAVKVKPSFAKKWYERFQETGGVDDMPGKGRKSVFSASALQLAQGKLASVQSCAVLAGDLKASGSVPATTHRTTVWRNVQKGPGGMRFKAERRVPKITEATAKKRVEFAKHHLEAETDWSKVMATDSSIFRFGKRSGSRGVWVLKDVIPEREVTANEVAVHVYGGITAHGKTPLVPVSGTTGLRTAYISKGLKLRGVGAEEFQMVLGVHLVPAGDDLFESLGCEDWQMLMDRAPAHTAKSTGRWLESQGVNVVQHWPSNSPDLNPIENVWGWMKKRVYRQNPRTMQQLKEAIDMAWDQVPETMLTHLMLGMPARLHKVMQLDGKYIGM
jgi:hypothetical protein